MVIIQVKKPAQAWAAQLNALRRAAAALRTRAGARTACVITCGSDGMALADAHGDIYRGRLDHLGRFPVGCGDVALAAFAIAMIRQGLQG